MIFRNFVQPVTIDDLNDELANIQAELIDVVKSGEEGIDLYFARYDGAVDCLRLIAMKGPHGAPALGVEYLPYTEERPAEDAAEGTENDG